MTFYDLVWKNEAIENVDKRKPLDSDNQARNFISLLAHIESTMFNEELVRLTA